MIGAELSTVKTGGAPASSVTRIDLCLIGYIRLSSALDCVVDVDTRSRAGSNASEIDPTGLGEPVA
jgi:hypothetical protein